MRLLRDLKLLITEADDGTGAQLFDSNGTLARSESAVTFVELRNDGTLDLDVAPAAGNARDVPFGDVTTCHFLLLVTDEDLTLTFNGGVETLDLKVSPGTSRAMLYWEGAFTSVGLANAGTAKATVLYAVVGV